MARDKQQDIVVIREDTGSGVIPGLLLGLLAGAAVGLWKAPASGSETRQKLLARARGLLPGGQEQQTPPRSIAGGVTITEEQAPSDGRPAQELPVSAQDTIVITATERSQG